MPGWGIQPGQAGGVRKVFSSSSSSSNCDLRRGTGWPVPPPASGKTNETHQTPCKYHQKGRLISNAKRSTIIQRSEAQPTPRHYFLKDLPSLHPCYALSAKEELPHPLHTYLPRRWYTTLPQVGCSKLEQRLLFLSPTYSTTHKRAAVKHHY